MQHVVRESAFHSFSFPPGTTIGRGVRRTGAPQPTQQHCTWQSGLGETPHVRFTLRKRVVFSSSLSMFPSIKIYLDSPSRRLLSSSTRQVAVELRECRSRNCEDCGKALVFDTITTRSHRCVVMPEARAGGSRGTASSSTPVAWQIDAACTAVFSVLQRLLPPAICGNPSRFKSRRHFRTQIYPK